MRYEYNIPELNPRRNPYDYQQNRIRKAMALRRCVEVLEGLQQNYPPIFNQDPMILRYLEQLQVDITALENYDALEAANVGEFLKEKGIDAVHIYDDDELVYVGPSEDIGDYAKRWIGSYQTSSGQHFLFLKPKKDV